MKRKLATLILILLGMAFTGSASAVEFEEFGSVAVHGFISQGYLISDENNFYADTRSGGTSQFNEAAVNFTTDVSERLRLGIQLFARDLGRMGNNEVTLDWAFADYSFQDWLNLRAGRVKMPYGLYNTERDVDMLRTFVFLPQSVYNEGWRDSANALNGAGFYGYVPAGMTGNFSYEIYGGNTAIDPEGGIARLLQSAMPPPLDFDVQQVDVDRTAAGTLTWESIFGLDGLRVVASAWEVNFDAQADYNNGNIIPWLEAEPPHSMAGYQKAKSSGTMNVNTFVTAFSFEYAYENLIWAAEVSQNDYDFVMPGLVDKSFKSLGWYSSLTYRFTDWFELGAYYSEYYADADDKDGSKAVEEEREYGRQPGTGHNDWLKDICLTARFDITANWVFKLEGHSMNGSALLYTDENDIDDNGFPVLEEDWFLGAAKLSYSF